MHFKEIASRITGVSVPIFGIQWTPAPAEVTIARNLLRHLEDKRVLYRPEEMEGAQYCVRSVEDMRKLLTHALQQVEPSSHFGKQLSKLRRACRDFCDIVGSQRFAATPIPVQRSLLGRELGKLRKVAGVAVASMSLGFGLDVEDELASIIPFNNAL